VKEEELIERGNRSKKEDKTEKENSFCGKIRMEERNGRK
jgi:hypothetical protein